jgi:hypothetical protein
MDKLSHVRVRELLKFLFFLCQTRHRTLLKQTNPLSRYSDDGAQGLKLGPFVGDLLFYHAEQVVLMTCALAQTIKQAVQLPRN